MHQVGAEALAKRLANALVAYTQRAIDREQYKAVHNEVIRQFESGEWMVPAKRKREKVVALTHPTHPLPPPPPRGAVEEQKEEEDESEHFCRYLINKSPLPVSPDAARLLVLALKHRYNTMAAQMKRDYSATLAGTAFMAAHGRETSYPHGELQRLAIEEQKTAPVAPQSEDQLAALQQQKKSNATAASFAKRRRTTTTSTKTTTKPAASPPPEVPLFFALKWLDPYFTMKQRMIIMNGIGAF
jgi:hypothetical protein